MGRGLPDVPKRVTGCDRRRDVDEPEVIALEQQGEVRLACQGVGETDASACAQSMASGS